MKRFLYTLILVLCTIIIYGQKRAKPDEQVGEFQFISGGTQVIYIQPEPEKEVDTLKVKSKKEKIKLVKDTVKKQPKTPKIKKELPAPFIGTSLGIGIDYSLGSDITMCSGHFGLDMAFYCTEKFAMGGYLKYHTIAQLSGGFLFVHHFKNPNAAFLWGFGVDGSCGEATIVSGEHPILPYAKYELLERNCGAEIRFGCQFNKNWYMWFDMSHKITNGSLYVDENGSYSISFPDSREPYYMFHGYYDYSLSASISIGYKFNNKRRK